MICLKIFNEIRKKLSLKTGKYVLKNANIVENKKKSENLTIGLTLAVLFMLLKMFSDLWQ
jgi:hypothetical protein